MSVSIIHYYVSISIGLNRFTQNSVQVSHSVGFPETKQSRDFDSRGIHSLHPSLSGNHKQCRPSVGKSHPIMARSCSSHRRRIPGTRFYRSPTGEGLKMGRKRISEVRVEREWRDSEVREQRPSNLTKTRSFVRGTWCEISWLSMEDHFLPWFLTPERMEKGG